MYWCWGSPLKGCWCWSSFQSFQISQCWRATPWMYLHERCFWEPPQRSSRNLRAFQMSFWIFIKPFLSSENLAGQRANLESPRCIPKPHFPLNISKLNQIKLSRFSLFLAHFFIKALCLDSLHLLSTLPLFPKRAGRKKAKDFLKRELFLSSRRPKHLF